MRITLISLNNMYVTYLNIMNIVFRSYNFGATEESYDYKRGRAYSKRSSPIMILRKEEVSFRDCKNIKG